MSVTREGKGRPWVTLFELFPTAQLKAPIQECLTLGVGLPKESQTWSPANPNQSPHSPCLVQHHHLHRNGGFEWPLMTVCFLSEGYHQPYPLLQHHMVAHVGAPSPHTVTALIVSTSDG